MICLALGSCERVWSRVTDLATCFGVHFAPERRALISHGELEISRLREAGEILWRTGGADIFSGELALMPTHIEVRDFNGLLYRFDYDSGAKL